MKEEIKQLKAEEEIKQLNAEEIEKVSGGHGKAVCEKQHEKGDDPVPDWRDTPTFRPDPFGFPSM